MSKLTKFVHFKHLQVIVCQLQLNEAVFQGSGLAKNHPSRWMVVPFTAMERLGQEWVLGQGMVMKSCIVDMLNFT